MSTQRPRFARIHTSRHFVRNAILTSSLLLLAYCGIVPHTAHASLFYSDNFDSDTVGTLPSGWANLGGATWQVGTTSPISGSHDLEDPTFHVGGIAVYTGASSAADSDGQISQVVTLGPASIGANTGLFLRVSADGSNGYLFAPDFWHEGLLVFKKVSGSYAEIGGSSAYPFGRTFSNGDIAILKAEVSGTTISWKAWKSTEAEPASWTQSFTDSSVTAPGYIGLYEGFNNQNPNNYSTSRIDDFYWGSVGSTFSPPAPATGFVLSGPTSGVVNSASTNFTITPNGAYTGTITPTTTGTGTFTPASLSWSASSTAQTFTYTPSSTTGSPNTIGASASPSLTNSSGSISYTVSSGGTIIPVNNSSWVAGLSPYNWYSSGSSSIQTVNPGAYFKVDFSGTSAQLGVDVSAINAASAAAKTYPRITWQIDGGAWQTYQLLSTDVQVPLASSLANTTHSLEVVFLASDAYTPRWNGTMSLKITNLTLDTGATLSTATILPKKLLAFGDSITEGAWVLGNHNDLTNYSDYESATSSYLVGVASDLDAEYGTAAFGGQAWESTFNGDIPSLPNAWSDYFSTNSRLSGGLLSPPPDYILVNMGTNGGVSTDSVVSNWLTALRAAAGPSAKIFVISPFNESGEANLAADFNSYVTSSSDTKAFLIDLGSNGVTYSTQTPAYSYDGLHPDAAGHAQLRTLVSGDIAADNVVVPPGAPTSVSATSGNAQATVTFAAPSSNGGSSITGYTVTSSPSGGVDSNAGSTSLTHTITGLTNGTAYTFTVNATNAVGTGASSSASNSVTPITVPSTPTQLQVNSVSSDEMVGLSWSAPASNGGSAITDYTLQYRITGTSSWTTFPHSASPSATMTVTGILGGPYDFQVAAVNGAGTSSFDTDLDITLNAGGGSSGGWGGSAPTTPSPTLVAPTPVTSTTPTAPVRNQTIGSVSTVVSDNGTYYLITGTSKFGITSPGILKSYGYTFSDATPITPAQSTLPVTSNLPPNSGSLVKTALDPTVYLVSNGQRLGFVSSVVFTALGYKFSSVLTVTTPELDQLSVAPPITSGTQAHPAGTNVLLNSTVYYIGTDNALHPYPSVTVYNSWNIPNDFSTVVQANAADQALPIGTAESARV